MVCVSGIIPHQRRNLPARRCSGRDPRAVFPYGALCEDHAGGAIRHASDGRQDTLSSRNAAEKHPKPEQAAQGTVVERYARRAVGYSLFDLGSFFSEQFFFVAMLLPALSTTQQSPQLFLCCKYCLRVRMQLIYREKKHLYLFVQMAVVVVSKHAQLSFVFSRTRRPSLHPTSVFPNRGGCVPSCFLLVSCWGWPNFRFKRVKFNRKRSERARPAMFFPFFWRGVVDSVGRGNTYIFMCNAM